MILPSTSLAGLAALLVSGLAVNAGPVSSRAALLRTLAEAKNKYFGTATTAGELRSNGTYKNVAGSFGVFTPGNEMKWDATEPNQGNFQFTDADYTVNYAQSVGGKVRGHTLVWHSQLPSWVSAISNKVTLTSVLTKHINTVVGRYKGKVLHWDVVNEAFNDDGSLRSSVWSKVFGQDLFAVALKLAHAADPDAKLYINDYSIEDVNSKSTALYNKAKALLAAGVPLHGIGFQSHLIVGQQPSSIVANFKRFADLGLDVAITELDIRMPVPASSSNLAQQAKDYTFMVKACLSTKRCVGITIWDFTDKYSWIPSVFPGTGAALPWDEYFNQKPAYAAIAAALA